MSGFKRDAQGNLMFELTDEEKLEIQKSFDRFKSPDGAFYVKNDSADEIQRIITAGGLFDYAKDQIMRCEFDINKGEKKEFINKAIASVSKAYSDPTPNLPKKIFKFYRAKISFL